jgi:hypothetical protein
MRMRYKVLGVRRDKRIIFDNYLLDLVDQNGNLLKYPVEFTAKYICSRIKQKEIAVEYLNDNDILTIVKNFEIIATILPKYQGEPFVANKFTNPVTEDDGETWIKPVVGKTYYVYKDGYRVIYDKLISFKIIYPDKSFKSYIKEKIQICKWNANNDAQVMLMVKNTS